jgi:dihydroorotase-like cyclic amidohydrolase
VVVDARASKRNRGPEGIRVPTTITRHIHAEKLEHTQAEREQRQAEETAKGGGAAAAENYQTKPNRPEDPEALEKHQRLMETADSILKLSASLTPKRPPSQD